MTEEAVIRAAAEYWRAREREERAGVIETTDEGTMNLLARCAHNYTRGMADALEWVLGAKHGALDRDD